MQFRSREISLSFHFAKLDFLFKHVVLGEVRESSGYDNYSTHTGTKALISVVTFWHVNDAPFTISDLKTNIGFL